MITRYLTASPGTGFPYRSVSLTFSGAGSGAPTAAVWWFPASIAMVAGRPGTATALKTTSRAPSARAVMYWGRAWVPSVQVPGDAMPAVSVRWDATSIEPPPDTRKRISRPGAGTPSRVVSDSAGTLQRAAAAPTSIVRAAAPA